MAHLNARTAILTALIAVLGPGVVGWVAGRQNQQPETRFTVVVRHQTTSASVANAVVTLVVTGRPYKATTADDGLATLTLVGVRGGETGLLTIERSGFAKKTEAVTLSGRDHEYLVPLSPDPDTVPVGIHPEGTDLEPVTISLTFASAPAIPPDRERWSAWHSVCSGELPEGYVVEHAALYVAGDYACGSWAECQVTELGAARACGRFRIQRRGDAASPGSAPVHGFLNVRLAPRS